MTYTYGARRWSITFFLISRVNYTRPFKKKKKKNAYCKYFGTQYVIMLMCNCYTYLLVLFQNRYTSPESRKSIVIMTSRVVIIVGYFYYIFFFHAKHQFCLPEHTNTHTRTLTENVPTGINRSDSILLLKKY